MQLDIFTARQILDDTFQRGRKVPCPFCSEYKMSQNYSPYISSGIYQHMWSSHPEHKQLLRDVAEASHTYEEVKAHEWTTKKKLEAELDQKRLMVQLAVSGAFLQEVVRHMDNLIRMMEPYYFQNGGEQEAQEFIDVIKTMVDDATRSS